MKTYTAATALLAAFAMAGAAAGAPAPAAPAPASAPAGPAWGPPLPGVCVLDGNRAIRVSAAGVAANSQLQGFSTQAQSEIAATRDALVRDDKALAAAKATLQAADYQAKANALRTRQQALQRDVQARNAQLEAARTDANSHIGQTMAAAANEVVNQHHCSVVLDATKIYGAAPGMNITDQVVQIMNVRQPSFTVQMPARPGGAAAPQH